jgi:plastocyanin
MTWAWRIFSRLLSVAAVGLPLVAASVTSSVVLKDSHLPAVRKGHDYSGVVVWLLPASGAKAHVSTVHAKLIQKDKTFTPHILAVETGTTVDFPNFDPIFHSDIGLYPPGTTRSIRFQRSGAVRIFCNIHPTMSAVILVLDTPYFAVSGRDGRFRIGNLAPGEYQLKVFHERSKEEVLQALERNITLATDDLTLAPLEISESGYLPAPHKNKYGKDYSQTVDDGVFYPGTSN